MIRRDLGSDLPRSYIVKMFLIALSLSLLEWLKKNCYRLLVEDRLLRAPLSSLSDSLLESLLDSLLEILR